MPNGRRPECAARTTCYKKAGPHALETLDHPLPPRTGQPRRHHQSCGTSRRGTLAITDETALPRLYTLKRRTRNFTQWHGRCAKPRLGLIALVATGISRRVRPQPRIRLRPWTSPATTPSPVRTPSSSSPISYLRVALFGLEPMARGWRVALLRRELRRVTTVAPPQADLERRKTADRPMWPGRSRLEVW